MIKSIVTEYMDQCLICGSPNVAVHHLISGTSGRRLAEQDSIVVGLCPACHNLFQGQRPRGWNCDIHHCPKLERMGKIIGQLAWEKHHIAETGCTEEEARDSFRLRYGKAYV